MALLYVRFALLGVVVALTACGGQQRRSMDDMRGGCDDYQWNMKEEFRIADEPGEPITAYSKVPSNAATAPINRKLEAELFPTGAVKFIVEPERRGKRPDEFAGLIRFVVPESGFYRVSTGTAFWVEVVDSDGNRIRAPKFEMQSQCNKVFKSAAFPLKANSSYWLQMSASRGKEVYLIITREPK